MIMIPTHTNLAPVILNSSNESKFRDSTEICIARPTVSPVEWRDLGFVLLGIVCFSRLVNESRTWLDFVESSLNKYPDTFAMGIIRALKWVKIWAYMKSPLLPVFWAFFVLLLENADMQLLAGDAWAAAFTLLERLREDSCGYWPESHPAHVAVGVTGLNFRDHVWSV